jgi:hypothetical protein
MEDKRFPDEADAPEQRKPGWIQSEEMAREIDELGRLIDETNELLGLPPMCHTD